jgi:ubiquinone/menaquinone biosynthesis C-methylase UbiE
MKKINYSELYDQRFFSQGYPNLVELGIDYKIQNSPNEPALLPETITPFFVPFLKRIANIESTQKKILVIGCGPKPLTITRLLDLGFDPIGIEPVAGFVSEAQKYVGDPARILKGSAEAIPVSDETQNFLVLESVMEHIDSPFKAMAEFYRVLAPGGIVFITTTNRYLFSITGKNGEFRKLFFNWFPDIVKESYIFHHLHYDPELANYSSRPAVHWYSFSDLCKIGRNAGFSLFYSPLDIIIGDDPSINKLWLVKRILPLLKYHPWWRALALTFSSAGSSIFMVKQSR